MAAPASILADPATGLIYPQALPDTSVEGVTAALDLRDPAAVVIAVAGDSTTSPYGTGAVENAFKELAAEVWPDRPFHCLRWDKDGNAYPGTPIVWQTAAQASSPGGTRTGVVVGSDSFSGSNSEMVGRAPETGAGAWGGTSGAWLANAGELRFNAAYSAGGIPAMYLPVLARANADFLAAGEWRVATNEAASKQRRLVFNNAGALISPTELRIYLNGATTGTVTLAKVTSGTIVTLASFPAGTIPASTAAAWYPFTMSLAGTTVSATVNGATVTAELTTSEVAALGSNFGINDHSTNAGLRNYTVKGSVTDPPIEGGTSPLSPAMVYNASVAGSKIDYQQARLDAMYPVQPHLVIINHGHNYPDTVTGDAYVGAIEGFLAALFTKWKRCPVIVWSQNPEFTPRTTAQISANRNRMLALRKAAARNGWGYIPIMEAFVALSDGGLSVIQPDGLHPVIGPGTAIQKTAVKSFVRRRSLRP